MSNNEEVNYDGLYVLGLKQGKKFQFLHKVKNGVVVRNGIHSNILIFKEGESNSEKARETINNLKTYEDFSEYPLKDIIEQNKPAK